MEKTLLKRWLFNRLSLKRSLVNITKLLFFSSFVLNNHVDAQVNLVPNASFENYVQCPSFTYVTPPPPWFCPTNQNPSYVNYCNKSSCKGIPRNCLGSNHNYQFPKTGDGYIGLGFFNNGVGNNEQRGYYEIRLSNSLSFGQYYYIGYNISLTNGVKYATNNASVLITDNAVYVDSITTPYGVLFANPQIVNYGNPVIKDTQNWVLIGGIYKALGGEKYITIGNFKSNSQTRVDSSLGIGNNWAIYNIDDVFVIPLDSMPLKADAGADSTITIGDSVFIGSLTNGIDSLKWQIQSTGIAIDSTRPGFWVHPLVNTCYVLTQTVNGFTSSDTVCVNVLPLPLKMLSFTALYQPPLTPPKEGNVLLQWQTANEINVSHFNILKSIDGGLAPSPLGEGWGEVYYKIAAIDFDGKMSFSEVRKINSNYQLSTINVYPNPTNGLVNIKLPTNEKGNWQVSITDVYGKKIAEKKLDKNTINTQLNLIGNKGLYFVKIYNNNTGKQQISKIILQ